MRVKDEGGFGRKGLRRGVRKWKWGGKEREVE